MSFLLRTSYFYQIRFFTPNAIPVSVCMSDPFWYQPPQEKEYYIDKRGVVNGLRYNPLIVQKHGTIECTGLRADCPYFNITSNCSCLKEYEQLLSSLVDIDKTMKAFEFCANKFKRELDFCGDPIICLMLHEAPQNPCSERTSLWNFFRNNGIDCKEWVRGE